MDINYLITDWAYRVNDGMPDPKNRNHLELLEATLRDHKYSEEFIAEYIKSISNPSTPTKDFQELCVEIGKILAGDKLITESSVWLKSPGTEQLASVSTLDYWKGAPKGPYTIASETKDATEVDIGGTKDIKTAYIKAGSTVYKIYGSMNKMSKLFKNASSKKSPFKIKWGDATFESAACTGLYFDPNPYYNKIMSGKAEQSDVDSAISAFKAALNKGSEYGGKSALLAIEGIPDLIKALEIANGVYKFAQSHGIDKNWNFIHSSIQKYYKAGYKNSNLDSTGFKDNTADTIILNGSPAALISQIETEKVTFDGKGKCKTESGIEFYQVSNKAKEGGAQLGRIQQAFSDMYGLSSPMDTWRIRLTKESQEHADKEFLLNEGLAQYFNQGLKWIKDTFTAAMNKINTKISSFGSSIMSALKTKTDKPSPSLDSFMKKRFNSAVKRLDEAKKPRYSYSEYAAVVGKLALQGDTKEINSLAAEATAQFKILKGLTSPPDDGIDMTKISAGPQVPKISSLNHGVELTVKLMVNYMAYEHLNAMLSNSKGTIKEVSKILEEFVDLEKEMYFGKTDLPMFKVYGTEGMKGTAWSYLKSGKEYKEDRLNAMDMKDAVKGGKYVPGVVVESSPQKGKGHTSVKVWILHSITSKGTKYTKVDLRSGKPYTLAFSVSGTGFDSGTSVLGKI
jgi:hypothetical protein